MKKNRISVQTWKAKPLVEQSESAIQLQLKTDGKSFWLVRPGYPKFKWEWPAAKTIGEFKRHAIKGILSGAEKFGFIQLPPVEWIDRDFIERLARALEKSKKRSDADILFESEWHSGRFQKLTAREIASQLSAALGVKLTEDYVYKTYFYRGTYPYAFDRPGPQNRV